MPLLDFLSPILERNDETTVFDLYEDTVVMLVRK